MPKPRILVVYKPNTKYPERDPENSGLLRKIKEEFKLAEMPSCLKNTQADAALSKVDEGIDVVLLYTLRLEGSDKRLGKNYENAISDLTIQDNIDYHHGLPRRQMTGLSFLEYLKSKGIKTIVITDVHHLVHSHMYRLGVERVYNSSDPTKYVIETLKELFAKK